MSHTIAIIAPSSVPYQIGGAEKFWLGLHRALSRYSGSSVELIKLPCPEDTFPEVVRSYRTFSELNLDHFDMVISTKYPAWMVRHHNHVLYLQHTLRGLYDTYHFTGLPERLDIVPTGLHDLMGCLRKEQPSRDDLHTAFDLLERAFAVKSLPSSLFAHPGPLLRETVHFFDRVALHPAQITAYLAISGNVTRRKDYFPQGVSVKILHHPSDILEYANNGHEFFFTASRLNRTKRVHLIVEAMRHVSGNTPLLIAGTGPELPFLRDLAGDDPRIRFLGYVPDEELPGYYANALAVPYTPMDEDYGLITIEAMHSGKPVITTHDAGGPCEFVHDGKTGTVCDPTPESLGRALNRMAENPELAARLGHNAQQAVANIVWPKTVRELMTYVGHCGVTRARHARRTILVLSTYPADGQGAGGQRRLYHMCLALARHWHVLLVCYDAQQCQAQSMNELAPHLQEWRLPHGAAREEAARLSVLTGESTDDVALMHTCVDDVVLGEVLCSHGRNAACAVLAHPFLYPALRKWSPHTPFIYDAHNVEADLKAQLLPSDLAAEVGLVEGQCAQNARHVLACSEDDARRLVDLYGIPAEHCHCVPNGCDMALPAYASSVEKRRLRHRLDYPEAKLALFLGSGHKPNREAAAHIIRMAPLTPEVHFLLAGTVSTQADIREMPRPGNVHLLGSVSEDVKNVLLRAADIALNPMTSGAGTNLKIVEYLAVGLETISTPFGLRGLPADVAACAHAVPVAEFPEAIYKVLAMPMEDARLAAAAKLVRSRFAWPEVLASTEAIVRSVTEEV